MEGTPMTAEWHSFGARSLDHVLQKLQWEIGTLESILSRITGPVQEEWDAEFSACNAFFTTWSLSDWVWSELSRDAKEKLELKNKKSLNIKVTSECLGLLISQRICTASKHPNSGRAGTSRDRRNRNAQPSDVVCRGTFTYIDEDSFNFDLIISYEGKEYSALQMLQESRDYWYEFCYAQDLSSFLIKDESGVIS